MTLKTQDIRLAIADQILAENSGYLNCWNRIGIGRIRATCDKSLTWASVRMFCRNRITDIWRYLRSEAAICNKIAAVCVIYWPFDIRAVRITQDEHRMFIQLTLRPVKDALVGNLSEIKIKCSSPQTTQMVTLIWLLTCQKGTPSSGHRLLFRLRPFEDST